MLGRRRSSTQESEAVKKLIKCLEELERVNVKFEKKEKEKEFKFTNKGCEKQFKFNGKMKELFSDKLKVELKKHFKDGLPEKVEEIIREGEKEVDEQNYWLKISDDFRLPFFGRIYQRRLS